ncbi:MAG: PilC/PilY family type IV pilus protein [Duganella sp.]
MRTASKIVLWLALAADGTLAAPLLLDIASEPLTAACRVAVPPSSPAMLDGASLLQPAALSHGGGELFRAAMRMSDGGGHLTRYLIAPDAAGLSVTPQVAWEAGALLTGSGTQAPSPAPAARHIYTAIIAEGGALSMTAFDWSALSSAQQAQLDQPPQTAVPAAPSQSASSAGDGLGPLRLAYLRGDRTHEGTLFRVRSSVLGNSVHSTPVRVGQPPGVSASAPVRPDMLYLGANDGMLHAFDVADGRERFAYVPAAVFGALNQLPDPAYVQRAYVDGPASAGEVSIAGQARTVLLSGMGGGAQGVFALDITDPVHFADKGGVLWEFTDRDDPMMGNVTALPQIARLRINASSAGKVVYRYFAVVASGLNNYAADGHASSSGEGALFLLALDKPRNDPWRLQDNYYRFTTPIADATLANALHAPVLVNDRAGSLRYAYAGDLQGNLWRFDFSGGLPWKQTVGPGPNSTPLFVARDAAGKRQPITQLPQVVYAEQGGYLLLFGTGKLIEQADRSAARYAPQSLYAIHDSLRQPADIVSGRHQLTRRTLLGDAASASLAIEGEAKAGNSKGWYLDLLHAGVTGERSIDSGVIEGGVLAITTVLPATDSCDSARSRSYVLNALTGLAQGHSVSVRLPPAPAPEQPIVGDLSLSYDGKPALLPLASSISPPDPTGGVRVVREFALAHTAAGGQQPLGTIRSVTRAGRLSWREVANWRQLHENSQPAANKSEAGKQEAGK